MNGTQEQDQSSVIELPSMRSRMAEKEFGEASGSVSEVSLALLESRASQAFGVNEGDEIISGLIDRRDDGDIVTFTGFIANRQMVDFLDEEEGF